MAQDAPFPPPAHQTDVPVSRIRLSEEAHVVIRQAARILGQCKKPKLLFQPGAPVPVALQDSKS